MHCHAIAPYAHSKKLPMQTHYANAVQSGCQRCMYTGDGKQEPDAVHSLGLTEGKSKMQCTHMDIGACTNAIADAIHSLKMTQGRSTMQRIHASSSACSAASCQLHRCLPHHEFQKKLQGLGKVL